MEFVESVPVSRTKALSEEWIEKVRIMKENPGKTADVGVYSPAVATHIRYGMYKQFLPDDIGDDMTARKLYMDRHWHVTTRSLDGSRKTTTVYVTWLG